MSRAPELQCQTLPQVSRLLRGRGSRSASSGVRFQGLPFRRTGARPAYEHDAKHRAKGVIRKIPPGERASNQGVSDEGAPNGAQDGRLPELKRLQEASGAKNREPYESRGELGPDHEGEQDPEHDIQDSASMPPDPELCRARVELGTDPEGDYDCEKLQKRATKRLDRRRQEKDPSLLLEAA